MLLVSAQPAGAVSAALSPSSQSISSGDTASWGGAWGEDAPYRVRFSYGDGASWYRSSTYSTTQAWSRSFTTCSGQSYNQLLEVRELDTGASISASAVTHVSPGPYCR